MEKFLKNNKEILIREARIEDASILLNYMEIVNKESENLLREPHEFKMTIEQEESFIQKSINSYNDCHLLMFLDDKLISTAGFHGLPLERVVHRVTIGMSVLKPYWGLGAGSLMMEALIEKAKSYHKEKLELDVRTDNTNAIALYEKFGFKIEGQIKNGFKINEKYTDLLLMGLFLGE